MKPSREAVERAATAMLIEHDPIHCCTGMSYLDFVPLAYAALTAAMEPGRGYQQKWNYPGVPIDPHKYGLIRMEE